MSITERLQHKYALSHQGAKDIEKAIAACTLSNLSQMVPVGLLFMMTGDLFNGGIPEAHIPVYID